MSLNDKQIRFAQEYIIDLNATQAAIRAGYSVNTAGSQGHDLLKNPEIQEYIQKRNQEIVNKLKLTQERVLQEYSKIAFFDIRKAFDSSGYMIPLDEMDDDTAGAIGGIEIIEQIEKAGEETIKTGDLKKIKIWDKRAALDSICKVLGYNAADKIEHSGQIETTKPVLQLPGGGTLDL